MKQKRSQVLGAVGVVIIFLVVFLVASSGLALELKLQLYQGPEHMITRTVRNISPQVEQMTQGRVKIAVFDSGTLCKAPHMFDAVQKGVVDIAAWAYPYANINNLPFLMIGSFPFIYRDAPGYMDAWEKEGTLERLANEFIKETGYDNVRIMNTFYVGFYQMGFKDKEPKVPTDVKGLKMRSLGSILPFFKKYGISAVSLSTPQVYDALERGIVDGACGVYSNWIDWGWGEPATYLIDFNVAAVGLTFLVNKSSLEKLSKPDMAVVQAYLKWLQTALDKNYLKADVTYRTMVQRLMKVYTPTKEEAAEWKKAKDIIVEKWLEVVGNRGKEALEVINKYNGELTHKKR